MSLPCVSRGKVREMYDAGPDLLLMVATDRISAYDVVLEEEIPDKGKVLNGLSLFWSEKVDSMISTHLVTDDPGRFPPGAAEMDDLGGRAVLVRRAEMLPVEFIVRGYLYGSGYNEYVDRGTASGIELEAGLLLASRLPKAIVTPTTKAETGHDEAISPETAAELCGADAYAAASRAAIAVFETAHDLAYEQGVIIADTKFEFGIVDGEVILADEVLTPDSSRFWPADGYAPGQSQPSFDKQFVRDWLDESGWDHNPPAPQLPPEIIGETRAKYVEAFEKITGRSFAEFADSYA